MRGLIKRYGDVVALDNFNLDVQQGEIFGLLGPNGSGKSTSINCMLSLLGYEKGTVHLFGSKMSESNYALKKLIGVVPQDVAVIDELTVEENINYFCSLYVPNKAERQQLVDEAIEFVQLQDFRKYRPKKLSGGLLRRLNIACGIAHKPKLIFFDEPTVAVDPQSRNSILENIKKLNKQGATIVYTSHYMEEVESICDRILIMDHGRHVALGTPQELKDMSSFGEQIQIETIDLSSQVIQQVEALEDVIDTQYDGVTLQVKCKHGDHNLLSILDVLNRNNASVHRVTTQLPTLNDVFLDLTGKALRD
ncbi:MAG: ABC transporter ATP-binding protein [Bifidobacteriaceae bacterium]|nr:ABC transporter ATP-binding protein [Bifidobacteriaceae bacterium]